jgi:hypothetical protein
MYPQALGLGCRGLGLGAWASRLRPRGLGLWAQAELSGLGPRQLGPRFEPVGFGWPRPWLQTGSGAPDIK